MVRPSELCARAAGTVSVLALTAALGRSLSAQTLRGAVSDSVGHLPISGAVVMVLDSSGVVVGRNITDERGQYQIALTSAARSARVVRIGFLPTTVHLPPMSERRTPFDISMLPVRTMLAAVRIWDKSNCPRRSDGPAALGLWEQARAGLLATIVAREANPASIQRFEFERSMEYNSNRIARFSVAADSAHGAETSFNAMHAARDFAKAGFASDSAGVQILFGPDADVLLDTAFADAYCFRLAALSQTRPNEVGLSFAPAERRRGRVDIDGTLWVDTAARTLSDIEFRFVGLSPRTSAFHPGGVISFRQMPNGVVLIDRWYMRHIDATADPWNVHAAENGGELVRATWPNGATWHALLGTLRIHAVNGAGQPASSTVVALPGTPYRGIADTSGDITIADLIPGPYSLQIVDRRLSELGIRIPTSMTFVATRDSTFHTTLKATTAEETVTGLCVRARQWSVGDSVFILGRVVTTRGAAVEDAKVTFAVEKGSSDWSWLREYYTTGPDGLFYSCNQSFGLGGTVRIRVHRRGLADVDTTTTLGSKLTVMRIPIVVSP